MSPAAMLSYIASPIIVMRCRPYRKDYPFTFLYFCPQGNPHHRHPTARQFVKKKKHPNTFHACAASAHGGAMTKGGT